MGTVFNIRDFGARPELDLNTRAIQSAIDSCHEVGGGVVLIPAGRFSTGSLQLKSCVTLELDSGAVLVGSSDLSDYPAIGFHHNEFVETRSLLWAMDAENILLRGAGTIDFNHHAFMEMNTPSLCGPDGDIFHLLPPGAREEAVVVAKARPTQPMFFHDCKRLQIENILLQNSPCWTICLSACDGVQVRGISVQNDLRVPNCDGVNISSSRNVIITGCNFHCADDCVAITGITDWDRPAENIVINSCTMVSRSAAVRIGHLASKARNVVVGDLILSDGNRGICIFSGSGGWVENVRIHDVLMKTRMFPGFWWGKGEPLCICATHDDAHIEGVSMGHIRASSESGIIIAGKCKNVRDIRLTDWNLRLHPGRYRPTMGQWLDLQPGECPRIGEKRIPWLYQHQAEDVHLNDIRLHLDSVEAVGFSTEPIIDC